LGVEEEPVASHSEYKFIGSSEEAPSFWRSQGSGDGYIGYTFDNEWELVPGQWTIQILVGSKVMAEKTFNIFVAPSA
jgi:hypothetical protein